MQPHAPGRAHGSARATAPGLSGLPGAVWCHSVRQRHRRLRRQARVTNRPVSRILCRVSGGGHPSGTDVATGLVRSTRRRWAGNPPARTAGWQPFSILLRVGFAEPPQSPAVLVVSYTTVSPYPLSRGGLFSVALSAGHPGGRYPPPCPVGPDFPRPGPWPGRGRPAGLSNGVVDAMAAVCHPCPVVVPDGALSRPGRHPCRAASRFARYRARSGLPQRPFGGFTRVGDGYRCGRFGEISSPPAWTGASKARRMCCAPDSRRWIDPTFGRATTIRRHRFFDHVVLADAVGDAVGSLDEIWSPTA